MAERRLKERTQQVQRGSVLAAAATLFGQKGYENTTMAEVARLADVAVGTLYKLFPSKEAMRYALLEWRAEAVLCHAPQGEGARDVPDPTAGPLASSGVRQSGAEALLEEDQLGIWLDKEPERRQRDLQAKRVGILRAALGVFEEKGFYGATMADIAAEAGTATGTLYNFFASKDELFHTLLEQKASEFFAYLHEQVDPIPLAVDKIARMVVALVHFFEENREFLRLYAAGLIAAEVGLSGLAGGADAHAVELALGQFAEPRHLGRHRLRRRSPQPAGRSPADASRRHRGRSFDVGHAAVFDRHMPRGNQRRDLGVAELFQQTPHIAFDRLLPEFFPAVEIAAHQARCHAFVDGRSREGNQSALAVARQANRRLALGRGVQPIHRGEHLLDFVADHVPAQWKRLAIDPLAVRLVRHPHQRISGEIVRTADQQSAPARETRWPPRRVRTATRRGYRATAPAVVPACDPRRGRRRRAPRRAASAPPTTLRP